MISKTSFRRLSRGPAYPLGFPLWPGAQVILTNTQIPLIFSITPGFAKSNQEWPGECLNQLRLMFFGGKFKPTAKSLQVSVGLTVGRDVHLRVFCAMRWATL